MAESFVGIKQEQSGTIQYVVSMTIPEIADLLPLRPVDQWRTVGEYNRPIDKRHAQDIADYLMTAEEIVLPAMLVGVRPGSVEAKNGAKGWDGVVRVAFDRGDILGIGDGQHRTVGAALALAQLASEAAGEGDKADAAKTRIDVLKATSVAVVLRESSPEEMRQAYADLDLQKKAGPETRVMFDSRDVFAVAVRGIAERAAVVRGIADAAGGDKAAWDKAADAATPPDLFLARGGIETDSRTPGSSLFSLTALYGVAKTLYGYGGRGRTGNVKETATEIEERLTDYLGDLSAATPLAGVEDGRQTVADARDVGGVLPAFTAMQPIYAAIWRGIKFEGGATRESEEMREMLGRLPMTIAEHLALGAVSPFRSMMIETGKAPRGGAQDQRNAITAGIAWASGAPEGSAMVEAIAWAAGQPEGSAMVEALRERLKAATVAA